MSFVVINPQKCNGCGLCVEVCTCNALAIKDSLAVYIEGSKCSACTRWCCQCEVVCPTRAISCPFEVVIEEK